MNKSVFFDLDETLTINTAFVDARREFAELMGHEGFDLKEADQLMEKTDSEAVKIHGFGDKLRFSNSMAETYQELCKLHKKPVRFPVLEKARYVGLAALNKPVQLMPGAYQAVQDTKQKGYNVYVVTKGNVEIQEAKIKVTKLSNILDGWFVYDQKTLLEMYLVLEATKSAARYSYFVGNSPKSDVNPAYLAGLNAIYIHHPNTWIAELEPILEGVASVDHISDLVGKLS